MIKKCCDSGGGDSSSISISSSSSDMCVQSPSPFPRHQLSWRGKG